MKMTSRTKIGFGIAAIAVVLSLGAFRAHSYKSVAPCFNTPACQSPYIGTLKIRSYGFPTVYRQTATYKPDASNAFANSSVEQQGFSWVYVIANAIFWFALLEGVYRLWLKVAKKGAPGTAAGAASLGKNKSS